MIEVLFNDEISTLSFVHVPNKETLLIVGEDLKVYASTTYNPFEPSNEDLLNMWEKATREYYDIDSEEVFSEWRIDQKTKSDEAFKKWLDEDTKRKEDSNIG